MNVIHALVVDDNQQNMKVLVQMLARNGVQCTEVGNPTHLHVDLPVMGNLDLVFLDLEMPGLDGYGVKDLLRSYFADVPIIAYTVHVSEINVVRQLGFDGFLSKPLSPERFPDQLARILNGESVWERA